MTNILKAMTVANTIAPSRTSKVAKMVAKVEAKRTRREAKTVEADRVFSLLRVIMAICSLRIRLASRRKEARSFPSHIWAGILLALSKMRLSEIG